MFLSYHQFMLGTARMVGVLALQSEAVHPGEMRGDGDHRPAGGPAGGVAEPGDGERHSG